MELRERQQGKENGRATIVSHTTRCEGRWYKNVLEIVEKQGMGGKRVRESIRRDWTDQSKAHVQMA
jgi:hypothetical protein